MYRYTPLHSLYKDLIRAEKGYDSTLRASYAWIIANDLFSDYVTKMMFLRYWKYVEFYSKKRLQQVPVNGILFPVKYFNEEEIKE